MRPVTLMLLALALVTSLTLSPVATVHASVDWCWDDPVVVIGGRSVTIRIGVHGTPTEVRRNVRAANITIYVPEGTAAALSVSTNVYFREHVTFVPVSGGVLVGKPIPVRVVVTFDALKQLPAAMQITPVLTLHLSSVLTTTTTFGTTSGQLEASFTLY